MNRKELVNQTWSITWRNKSLWIIALLGAAAETVVSLLLTTTSFTASIASSLINTLASFVFTVFVAGALIKMIDSIAEGEEVRLNDGLQAGLRWFLPLLVISVILALPEWILLVVWTGSFTSIFSTLGQPSAFSATNLLNYVGTFLGVGGLSIVISLVTGAVAIGAQREIVLQNTPGFEALKRGWLLFRARFRDYVGIAATLFLIGLGVSLLFACAVVPIVNSMTTNLLRTGSSFDPASMFTSPAYVAMMLIGLVVNSLVTVFVTGIWTLAYRKWQTGDRTWLKPATIE